MQEQVENLGVGKFTEHAQIMIATGQAPLHHPAIGAAGQRVGLAGYVRTEADRTEAGLTCS